MALHLPTLVAANWTVAALRDSLESVLAADRRGQTLRLFYYAVTQPGWNEVRRIITNWRTSRDGREVMAYIGTDHGITEPGAIRQMVADGVSVWLPQDYTGIYHPKVVWLSAPPRSVVWIGSNNLTRDGLRQNIEFAVLVTSARRPRQLTRWAQAVHRASVPFNEALLVQYEAERSSYCVRRAELGGFIWSGRETPIARQRRPGRAYRPHPAPRRPAVPGDLVIEVMPRETGQDGKQIQLPLGVATTFFGMRGHVGETRRLILVPAWIDDPRDLTMTIFRNHTVRLVIRELDYRDRPCVLLFSRRRHRFSFDIVSRAVSPRRYRDLLGMCGRPTRTGSRRWGIV